MRTLVVDNYDSFTHNLVHLLAVVTQDEPIVVRNDQVTWQELRGWRFDAAVIGPGPGRPDRSADFGVSAALIRHARVPVLGVCLGHQGIAALHGGDVVRAPYPVHGKVTPIFHQGTGLFAGLPSPVQVGRYHSLVAARPLPDELEELAWTDDGLLMALVHKARPLWGVQFHPESILTEHGARLIGNFRDMARACSGRQPVALPGTVRRADAGALCWREIGHAVDAERAFHHLFGAAANAFWLDGALVEHARSRWSYFGEAAGVASYDAHRGKLTLTDGTGEHAREGTILDLLEGARRTHAGDAPPCPFRGGYVGWFGYEFAQACGGPVHRASPTPDALFMRAARFIAVDHVEERSYIVAADGDSAWVEETDARLRNLPPLAEPTPAAAGKVVFTLDRDRATYLRDVAQCLDWIRQGETYQVCLTNEITCRLSLDPFELYRVLRRVNPAPYAAYLRWPGGAVLSASPERFLRLDPEGTVETKPIKGTVARETDPARDAEAAERLRTSSKDRAENVMIVDLLRNDLSRVCVPGSVIVPKLCAVESYATVHQLVSTVRGRLRGSASVSDLMRAVFPGGSMTGAPKHRTLELLDKLEHRPRGIYAGALGWIGDDGAADLSIVIRTIVAQGDRLSVGVGGGIVAQSTPEGEFEEMLLKARAALRAIVIAAAGAFDGDGDGYELIGAEAASA